MSLNCNNVFSLPSPRRCNTVNKFESLNYLGSVAFLEF